MDRSPRVDGRRRRRSTSLGAVVIFAATLALLVATGPSLSIVWDEGYTLGREARVSAWLRALGDPARFLAEFRPPAPGTELVQAEGSPAIGPGDVGTRSALLRDPAIAYFWPFAREEPHGHPPAYAILGVAGSAIAPASWEPLARARLGPMIAFSLAACGLFAFFAARSGVWPGVLAAGAWVLQPRLFAHGHYALYDAPLAALWVGSTLAFALAARVEVGERPVGGAARWGWAVVFGLLVGAAMATKLTGWFLPIPFVAWAAIRRDRVALRVLIVGGLAAVVTLDALIPPWWGAPISGVVRFLRSNLGRADSIPIRTLFLGRVYNSPRESLPWYNTLAWMVLAAPVGVLALGVAGSIRSARRWRVDPVGSLALGQWALLLVLRSLPHTPGHDGDRQLVPAFGCLAMMAGFGAEWAVGAWGRRGRIALAAAIVEGAASVAAMMPVPLSYYSPIVGGLPGATRLGMEPTYYWDALTPAAVDWLNAHTPPGGKVAFATNPTGWLYLRQVGRLRPDHRPWMPGRYAWYVLQNRPGAMSPRDRALASRLGPDHVLVSKFGVPLVWAIPFRAVEARP